MTRMRWATSLTVSVLGMVGSIGPVTAQPATPPREPDLNTFVDRHVDLVVRLDLDRLAADPARRLGGAFLDPAATGRAAAWCDGPLAVALTAYFPEGESLPFWESWAVVATTATDDALPTRDLGPLVGGPDGRPWEATRRDGFLRLGGPGTAALLDDPSWERDDGRSWTDRLAVGPTTVLVAAYRRPSDAKIDGLADWLTQVVGQNRESSSGGLRPLLRAIAWARLAWDVTDAGGTLTLTVAWTEREKEAILDRLLGALATVWRGELPKTFAVLDRATVTREADRTTWRLTWTDETEAGVRDAVAEVAAVVALAARSSAQALP